MKYILWKDFFYGWCITDKANYECRVRNEFKIIKLKDCEAVDDALFYAISLGLSQENIIIID